MQMCEYNENILIQKLDESEIENYTIKLSIDILNDIILLEMRIVLKMGKRPHYISNTLRYLTVCSPQKDRILDLSRYHIDKERILKQRSRT